MIETEIHLSNRKKYQIVKKLGQGSNGQVYLLNDLQLGKRWAMKVLPSSQKEECSILKKMSHPAFPRIVDMWEEEERVFLVMDYIQGETLQTLLQEKKWSEPEIVAIGLQIAKALQYLHTFSPMLFYLDLKPENIMVDPNGKIFLIDLGSVFRQGEKGRISVTVGYASPEQISYGRKETSITNQSDIYSFGMVLYSLLLQKTKGLPIMEENSPNGFWVSSVTSQVSKPMEQIIEGCTRGRLEKRTRYMENVIQDLEELEKKWQKKGPAFVLKHPLFSGFQPGKRKQYWTQEVGVLLSQGTPMWM